MDMTNRDDMGRNALDENLTAEGTRDELVSPEQAGNHDADGTMGRTAGAGAGAIAGGVVGSTFGPIGAAVGAVAGAVIGHGGGNAAHKIGDDHDDMNMETDSSGDLGRHTGAGAGSIAGAVTGFAAGGPVGSVVGAVGGGMLGAAAGDASKHMGGDNDADYANDTTYNTTSYDNRDVDMLPGNDIPGVQTGGYTTAGHDTRGITEKAADAVTGDRMDDNTGGMVTDYHNTDYRSAQHVNDNTMRVPVVEEELNVQKQAQQAGEVQVHKHVEEEQVNVPVSLTREEVHVERRPVNRAVQPGETVLNEGDTIRVPVMEETVAVSKDARVVEEIEISKERVTEQQTVSDTVRRERVDVQDTTTDANLRRGDI